MVVPRQTHLGTREDRLEALYRQLVDAVEELSTSEGWARMLRAAARFHDYSPSNVLLIAAQRPDATRVAGIRTWNSLGRRVKRGEHGIAILAPCVYPAPPGTSSEESAVDAGAVPSVEPSRSAVPDRHLRGFRVVHVFDVTQTEGEPLAEVTPTQLAGAAPEGLWERLTSLAGADGYRIERGPCRRGTMGYTDFTVRAVRVRDDVDDAQAVKTLAHELGHIRADHEHRLLDYAVSRSCRGRAEVEAESIAYLVTAVAGVDSTAYSVPYLAGWSGSTSDALRESMAVVVAVAREVNGWAPGARGTIPPASRRALVSGPAQSLSLPPAVLR